MKYEGIYINDFGIFNNSRIENLNPSFNIIGGGNRAGKTTFLKLLRYIGYGIPKTDKVPPARSNYNVEAIVNDLDNRYSVKLNGYAKPKVNIINNNDCDIKKIFSDVDQFTYNQLFTITLDELRKLPEGVNDKEKLQSVLIGAGLKEYTLLPRLEKSFYSEAEKIGGKTGRVNVRRFKEYNQTIKEGLKLKNEAKSQVKKYYDLKKRHEALIKKIEHNQEVINDLEKKKVRLDLLKSNYQIIDELLKINTQLENKKYSKLPLKETNFYPNQIEELYKKYKDNYELYKEKINKFEINTNKNFENNYIDRFLNKNLKIDNYYNKLSGLEEKKNNIEENRNSLENEYNNIKTMATNISDSISEDLEIIRDIEVNIEQKNNLRNLVKEYEKTEKNIDKLDNKKSEVEYNLKEEKQKLEELNKIKDNKKSLIYLVSFITMTILITGISFIDIRLAGLYLLDLIILYKFISNKYKDINNDNEIKRVKDNLDQLKNKNMRITKEIEQNKSNQEDINIKLKELREKLKLNKEISPQLIYEYYVDLVDLRSKYFEYTEKKESFKEKEKEFITQLKNIFEFLKEFKDVIDIEEKNNISSVSDISYIDSLIVQTYKIKDLLHVIGQQKIQYEEIKAELMSIEGISFIDTDKEISLVVQDYKELSTLVEDYKSKKERVREIKGQLTNITDQIKTAYSIDQQSNKEEIINRLVKEFKSYSSKEDVIEKFDDIKKRLKLKLEEQEETKNKKEKIKVNMKNISSEDKIIEADDKIYRARENLRPVAERYAVNKIASFILNSYWQVFLKDKKDRLLNKASNIMKQITSGVYENIEPLDDISRTDFKIIKDDGTVIENIDYLSRGTIEQLYMAIRINRIMEIEPDLPVIIDDSLVNFDPKHLRNIFDIINNLKDRNQIFFLTCHPEQINYLDQKIDNKKYYWLKKGRFYETDKDDLIKNLK